MLVWATLRISIFETFSIKIYHYLELVLNQMKSLHVKKTNLFPRNPYKGSLFKPVAIPLSFLGTSQKKQTNLAVNRKIVASHLTMRRLGQYIRVTMRQNCSSGFSTRSDTNQPVQSQKMTRG